MAARARNKKPTGVAESAVTYAPRHLLLDTHVWIWWFTGDERLGRKARSLIRNTATVYISAASAWEMAIKSQLGKLLVSAPVDIATEIERDAFVELPITVAHAEATRSLPATHRDPFDRMLVAQALTEGLAIVTADDAIAGYNVPLIDARA